MLRTKIDPELLFMVGPDMWNFLEDYLSSNMFKTNLVLKPKCFTKIWD